MHPTSFSQMIGNETIKRQLASMVSKRAIGHALLFAGPDGIGKSLFAWALAASVLAEYDPGKDHARKIQTGQHPDIHVYRPEGKLGLHSIQSMRQLSEEVSLPPFESSWKVFIIHEADRMLSYSANALLKTFEEPPPRTIIILLSRSQAVLMPTILSRCSTLHFQALSEELIEAALKERGLLDHAKRAQIARHAQGSLGRALRLVEQGDAFRSTVLDLLAQGRLGNYRLLRESIQSLSEKVEAAKKQAEDAAKEEFGKTQADQLSALQRNAIEKELEGIAAMALAQESQAIFDLILSWYRDLQVLLLGGQPSQLANPDYMAALEQAVQRGEYQPLNQVYEAVEEAYLTLQRSTPIALCLETLLLKLDRV